MLEHPCGSLGMLPMGSIDILLGALVSPSSLDRRSIEFIVSPKKVVGCRGGSRNVEGLLNIIVG